MNLQLRPTPSEPEDGVAFVLALARALHGAGYPSHALEASLQRVSIRLGLAAQFFALPTGLIVAFGREGEQTTHLLRLQPTGGELGRLAEVDAVRRAVLAGELDPVEAAAALRRVEARGAPYGALVTVLATSLSAAAAACFLGGGWPELAAATLGGLVVGLLGLVVGRIPGLLLLLEALAGVVVAALAVIWSAVVVPTSTTLVSIAGLIVLVPGLTLTVAVTELASQHLVAGTARLTRALMALLAIGFGVALGRQLATSLVGAVPDFVPPSLLPWWTEPLALAAAALAYTVVLRAPLAEIPWIALAGVLAVQGTGLGVSLLGPELGAFLGALVVGVFSNLVARWRRRPAALTLVPGILLLVPGSVGVRSITAFLERETVTGIAIGFQMALVAVALAMGLLFANALVAAERRERPLAKP